MKTDNVKISNQKNIIFLFGLVLFFLFFLPEISFGAPLGKGVFTHHIHVFSPVTPNYPASSPELDALLNNPYITGIQLSYQWRHLEPNDGDYQWSIIDADIKPWADKGKKVWIEVITANKRGSETEPRGYPDWIAGAPYNVPIVGYYHIDLITDEQRSRYPVFWDPNYQMLWGRFVEAFAAKFDGHPAIEFISVSGYSAGTEARLSAEDNEYYYCDWINAGLDPGIPKIRIEGHIVNFYSSAEEGSPVINPCTGASEISEAVYLKTNLWAIDLFKKYFIKTPLILNLIKWELPWSQERYDYAGKKGIGFGNNGLTARVVAEGRQFIRDIQLKYNVPVAYFERGPDARTDPGLDGELGTADDFEVKLLELYKRGMGVDGDLQFNPWSRRSYMPVGKWKADIETEIEWNEALKWVYEAEYKYIDTTPPAAPTGVTVN